MAQIKHFSLSNAVLILTRWVAHGTWKQATADVKFIQTDEQHLSVCLLLLQFEIRKEMWI